MIYVTNQFKSLSSLPTTTLQSCKTILIVISTAYLHFFQDFQKIVLNLLNFLYMYRFKSVPLLVTRPVCFECMTGPACLPNPGYV